MKTYRLSSAGRRTAIVLLLGALIIWAFALWTFQTTLGTVEGQSLGFFAAVSQNLRDGLRISQIVPALLMLVLIVATPLVIWNILEEWAATYTATEDGLRFSSLGVSLTYPWSGMVGLRREDDDVDEPLDEVLLNEDYTRQIRNPLLRFLHGQSYGRTKLPIYAGLENRDDLLAEIAARTRLRPAATAAEMSE